LLAFLLTQGDLHHHGILPCSIAGTIPELIGQSYSRFV
jgi:hypothetical protein